MKKIFLYFFVLAATVACNRVEVDGDLSLDGKELAFGMITEIISGSQGTSTKATISNDERPAFAWTDGDNVAVHVSKGTTEGTTGKYVFTSDQGAKGAVVDAEHPYQATFTVVYEADYSRDYFAIYPSTLVSTEAAADSYGQDANHPLVVTLPSSYTLAQVSGTTSPCPMISTNEATSSGWDFYQLCSLLRLTVDNIPETARRLEIDFDGKKVWGDFSIASEVVPGTYVISTADDADHDIITITKDNSDAVLGQTSLILNIPLPVGEYSKITVYAYDGEGKVVSFNNISFSKTATNKIAFEKATSLTDQSVFTFTFRDADVDTKPNLGGLRFVRVFSCQNKLYNGSTTFGPYTVSSATGEDDMANPVQATLKFGSDDGDQLAFQVIDKNGKVYSGLCNAPTGGFTMGAYDLKVDVKAYTFTMRSGNSGNKFYFSPGDLGVDNGVYSFTEPFTSWDHGNTKKYDDNVSNLPKQRVWFDIHYSSENAIITGGTVYGIAGWRSPNRAGSSVDTYEWNYLVKSRTMSDNVARYYKVTIPDHQYCLLLPPDEIQTTDIGDDLTSGEVTDYAKYLGKGFVLLFNTNRGLGNPSSWSVPNQGFYWTIYNSSNRFYFTWPSNGPEVNWGSARMKNHVRYVRNAN